MASLPGLTPRLRGVPPDRPLHQPLVHDRARRTRGWCPDRPLRERCVRDCDQLPVAAAEDDGLGVPARLHFGHPLAPAPEGLGMTPYDPATGGEAGRRPTAAELFAGVGGFHLALDRAGF